MAGVSVEMHSQNRAKTIQHTRRLLPLLVILLLTCPIPPDLVSIPVLTSVSIMILFSLLALLYPSLYILPISLPFLG